jgi:tRNA threonylcarbamoyl adenosine modification protein YjeE
VVEFETSLFLPDEAATKMLGARIANGLKTGDLVALSGELGAGKTALARAILHHLGVTEEVPSPSFTLVQSYDTGELAVYHFDLYRLERASELAELGLDDALNNGAALVEWPEHGLPMSLLDDALRISLLPANGESRIAKLSGPARWKMLVAKDAE